MTTDNRSVLITGASRGIGRAVAIAFATVGARVGVHYRADDDAATRTLESLPGEGHRLYRADVKDAEAVRDMVDMAAAELGGIDVLVNSAGVYEFHPTGEGTYETWQAHWRHTLGVNLVGAANVSYCAVQHMIRQGGGRIVNVSSRGAFRGEPDAPAYGASKAGLNAMSQSMAQSLAPFGIYVGVVAPGFVDTDMASTVLAGPRGADIRAQSPLKRVATAAEVAAAVLFLASPGSEFTTGAILDVNGASYLRS